MLCADIRVKFLAAVLRQWKSVQDLAVEARVGPSYTRAFRLSFLAPEITKVIVQGRQPSEFSAVKLMAAGRFARCWSDQRRQLGFD